MLLILKNRLNRKTVNLVVFNGQNPALRSIYLSNIIPAATVSLVDSSTRIKLPVTLLSL